MLCDILKIPQSHCIYKGSQNQKRAMNNEKGESGERIEHGRSDIADLNRNH